MANTEINELLRQYEEESCDHTDLDWVTGAALRLSQTMPDSQARCLLFTLATHVRGLMDITSTARLTELNELAAAGLKRHNEGFSAGVLTGLRTLAKSRNTKMPNEASARGGTADRGPWTVGSNDNGTYLESEDFTHDARLYITGDFESHEQRAEYAGELALRLNTR